MPQRDLQPLLAPDSIALIGASPRNNSYGAAMTDMALNSGFGGSVYLINPNYKALNGRACYSALSQLPEVVDHVVLAVARERVEACLEECIEHGARAATIFADCNSGDLAERIKRTALRNDILICGPNSMGFHNLTIGLRITPFPAPLDIAPGGIALILQSGSVMGALAHNDRRLRFSQLVSSGSEYSVSAADYLMWMINQPGTRVIGLFLESIRDPALFITALATAREKSIPIVVLKVGRTETAKRMATAHTGAVLGDHDVFQAVIRRYGVHTVQTLDEFAATLQVFSAARPAAKGAVAAIHDSGGERELLADLAYDLGVPLAELNQSTVKRIANLLEPGLIAENPLDAWASGKNAATIYRESLLAMLEDDNVALALYVLDWRENYYLHEMHEQILTDVHRTTTKPVFAVSNYSMTHNQSMADRMTDHGVCLLEGTRESLIAVRHLLAHRDTSAGGELLCKNPQAREKPSADVEYLCAELQSGSGLHEMRGFQLLAAYGISVPRHELVTSAKAAAKEAEKIGYPVVMKTAAAGISHKTEVSGVYLDLKSPASVIDAYHDLSQRLGAEVMVSEYVSEGSEWMVGILNDKDFGPAVIIKPGGIMVELLPEKVVLPAPFTAAEVEQELRLLQAIQLLTGYRGRSRLALSALCGFAERMSRLALDFRDYIQEMDVNPVIVTRDDAVAVDVLAVTKSL